MKKWLDKEIGIGDGIVTDRRGLIISTAVITMMFVGGFSLFYFFLKLLFEV